MFGIKLQLRSFSIKRCYSFRPIASYRDARGEETHVHTHAHLFLVKGFVTLSEIACRLPGFQRGKDRITIIGKSIGVSSPGNITSMIPSPKATGLLFQRIRYLKGFYHIWVWWPRPLKLIYSHCLIRFNISSENNDFGFNSIQKINFSKNFPFKCIRKQIWPWR